jgi:Rrf2 family protein
MKLSTRSLYGARLMLGLSVSWQENKKLFLKEFARKESMSEKYLGQIIITLKSAGLLNATRGARGGYTLTRDPSQISLADVVEALEGSLKAVVVPKKTDAIKHVSEYVTQEVWSKLNDAIQQTLASFSMQDLVVQWKQNLHKRAGQMYYI